MQVKDEQFLFDAVFTPGTQDEVFEDCRDLVQSAADGHGLRTSPKRALESLGQVTM